MQPIGIFDSGIGGLGIFQEIAQQLPHHDLIYCADNKNMPFGDKTDEQLRQITEKTVSFLIEKHNVSCVVAACNTASTATLAFLRQRFSLPIVGVVPVVKPACELTKTKKIAMLSTPATAQSAYQQELIKTYASGVHVLNIGCPGLASLIEAGHINDEIVKEKIKEFVSPVCHAGVDVIGLGCTHYPFVRHHIEHIAGPNVTILDSNQAVARQVARVVQQHGLTSDCDKSTPTYTIYATKDAAAFKQVAQQLVGNSLVSEVFLISL